MQSRRIAEAFELDYAHGLVSEIIMQFISAEKEELFLTVSKISIVVTEFVPMQYNIFAIVALLSHKWKAIMHRSDDNTKDQSMILNSDEIKSLKIVENPSNTGYRDVGYDLTVGTIYIPPSGDPQDENASKQDYRRGWASYQIPPQGLVLIISSEKLSVPDDICGFAMPKTSLCENGIFVLNTGVIDPGYKGYLSGTIVNFGKEPYDMEAGKPFLRLVFQRVVSNNTKKVNPPNRSTAERIDKVLSYPSTFLNVPETVRKVSSKVIEQERAFLLRVIAFIGVPLALITLILAIYQASPLYLPWEYQKSLRDTSQVREQLQDTQNEVNLLKSQNEILEHRLLALENRK